MHAREVTTLQAPAPQATTRTPRTRTMCRGSAPPPAASRRKSVRIWTLLALISNLTKKNRKISPSRAATTQGPSTQKTLKMRVRAVLLQGLRPVRRANSCGGRAEVLRSAHAAAAQGATDMRSSRRSAAAQSCSRGTEFSAAYMSWPRDFRASSLHGSSDGSYWSNRRLTARDGRLTVESHLSLTPACYGGRLTVENRCRHSAQHDGYLLRVTGWMLLACSEWCDHSSTQQTPNSLCIAIEGLSP